MQEMITNRKQGELSEKQTNEMLDELQAKVAFDLPEKLLENAISSTKANAERNKAEGDEIDDVARIAHTILSRGVAARCQFMS